MTKTDRTVLSDATLEDIFAAGRAEAPEPSEALMARILADAEAQRRAKVPVRPPIVPRRGPWPTLADVLGGWPALAGMVTATLAGVWFGFAAPDRVDTLSGGLFGPDGAATTSYRLEDFVPADGGLAAFYEEG